MMQRAKVGGRKEKHPASNRVFWSSSGDEVQL